MKAFGYLMLLGFGAVAVWATVDYLYREQAERRDANTVTRWREKGVV